MSIQLENFNFRSRISCCQPIFFKLVTIFFILFQVIANQSVFGFNQSYDNIINNVQYNDQFQLDVLSSSNIKDQELENSEYNVNLFSQLTYLDVNSLEYKDEKAEELKVQQSDDSLKTDTKPKSDDDSRLTSSQDEIATTDLSEPNQEDSEELSPEAKYKDPYEGYNRGMYYINKQLDAYLMKPPAQLYAYISPAPIRYVVSNFYSNLQDISVLINDLLQLELDKGLETLGRITLNSTFGVFGLLNVATDAGLPKRANDFGITFGKWGLTDSPYFVLPIFGPSTMPRDAVGTAIGAAVSISFYLPDDSVIPFTALYLIDKRANLLSLEKIIDTVADDEYIFVRNSYLEYRNSLINGEKPHKKREQKEEKMIDEILSDENKSLDSELEDI